MRVGGSLGCSDREAVEFGILRGGGRAVGRNRTMVFRRADFAAFSDVLGGIPRVRVLEGTGRG